MDLRSGRISGAKDESIAQNVSEMVEDIWEIIEKRVAIFFAEEQKQRKELINELALMREDNSKLRDNLNDLKLLISSQDKFVKSSSVDGEFIVANGNVVANNSITSHSIKEKVEYQLSEVRKAYKVRYYDERSLVQESEPARPNVNPALETTNIAAIQPATINAEDRATKIPLEKSQSPAKQKSSPSQWPVGTTLIVGDSMLGGIEESRLGPKRKVRSFPGATIEDMSQYIVPLLRKRPTCVVAHVGTNDASFSTAKQIADDLFKLQEQIHATLPECKVILSSPINRLDDPQKAVTIRNVNVILKNMSQIHLLNNDNISIKHLGKRKLHLNLSGSSMLARNILDKLRSL